MVLQLILFHLKAEIAHLVQALLGGVAQPPASQEILGLPFTCTIPGVLAPALLRCALKFQEATECGI